MEANFSPSEVEAEIAQLTQEIEAKRRFLEEQHGIVEEKDVVRAVVAEKFRQQAPVQQAPSASNRAVSPAAASQKSSGGSYLDSLDDDTVTQINALVEEAFSRGLTKSIAKAQLGSAFLLDAFHDALVDKLYDELKARKVVR